MVGHMYVRVYMYAELNTGITVVLHDLEMMHTREEITFISRKYSLQALLLVVYGIKTSFIVTVDMKIYFSNLLSWCVYILYISSTLVEE